MTKITLDLLLEKANRKLNVKGMDKDVVKITQTVITEMFKKGIYVGVSQAYRSKAEQDKLYAKGRTTAQLKQAGLTGVTGEPNENIVTYAKGGQSNHNFGVAVDLFQYNKDLSANFNLDANFKVIAKAMKAHGMQWGGDWTAFKDNPHFQLFDAYGGEKKKSNTTTSAKSKQHTVEHGDTLSELAMKYKTTVDKIMSVNPSIKRASEIYVGQVIKLPSQVAYKNYTVKRGDSLSQIADDNDTTVAELMKLNPNIDRPELIVIGDTVKVPK